MKNIPSKVLMIINIKISKMQINFIFAQRKDRVICLLYNYLSITYRASRYNSIKTSPPFPQDQIRSWYHHQAKLYNAHSSSWGQCLARLVTIKLLLNIYVFRQTTTLWKSSQCIKIKSYGYERCNLLRTRTQVQGIVIRFLMLEWGLSIICVLKLSSYSVRLIKVSLNFIRLFL